MDIQSFFISPFPLTRLPVAFLNVVCEMAPYLLLGFFIAGVLHVFVPQKFYANYLSRNNKLSAHGITVIRGCHGKLDDVLRSYQNGELQDSLESCDHHDCTHHQEKPVYVIPSFKK